MFDPVFGGKICEQWGGNRNLTQTMRNTLIGLKLRMVTCKSDNFGKSNQYWYDLFKSFKILFINYLIMHFIEQE